MYGFSIRIINFFFIILVNFAILLFLDSVNNFILGLIFTS